MRAIKCVVVGDNFVQSKRKTLATYTNGMYPVEYIPTVFDNYTKDIVVDEKPVTLGLWDTTGQEEYDRLRPLSYANANVLVLVFSTVSPQSLESIEGRWIAEIKEFVPKAKIILAGCHVELRNDPEFLTISMLPAISYEQGKAIAKKINASDYVEFSYSTMENLNHLFEQAARSVIEAPEKKKKNEKQRTDFLWTAPLIIRGENAKCFDRDEVMEALNDSTAYYTDKDGNTALHIAVIKSDRELFHLLFKKKVANIHARNESKETALHLAMQQPDEEIIRVLIHKDSDINSENEYGDTPLGIVEKSNNKALLEKINLWLKEARIARKERQFQQLVEEQSEQKAKEVDFASERKALYENVKELTENSPFITALQDLWVLKRQKQTLLSTEVERCLTELILNHLNPPQMLLRHIGYTPAEKLSLKLKNRTINPKHPIFSNLQKALKSIEEAKSVLGGNKVELKEIIQKLEEISNLYVIYIKMVCSAEAEAERKGLYKIPSILRGAGMEPRRLKEEGSPLSIKTMHGKKINEYGTSAVKIINGVHFKENPHAPGVEFMVSSLSNALAGRGATPTELIKVVNDKGQSINYLASKTIRGTELHDLIERHPDLINKISCRNFSEIMVLGLLINPQDGKPDNYMVEVQNVENGEIESLRIIGIDNDIAFADPVVLEHVGEKKGQHFVNVKNVIYLMPQMKKRFVKEFTSVFLQQSPEFVMIEWLKGLKEKNKEYQALLEEGVFTEKEFMGDGITSKLGLQLPIRLVPKTAATLYNKLKKIHHYLTTQPDITHEELFMKIQPILARYYRGIIQDVKGDVMEGIKLLYKQNAPTIEEEVNLESQIRSDNTRVMTELVLRTAERYGFEEKRVQTIDDSIREFIYAVDYSQYDKESTELLYQQYDGFGEIGLDYRNAKSFFVSALQEKQCSEMLLEHLFTNGDLDISVRLERSDDIALKGNESLLHLAAQYNQVEVVKNLVKRGIDVNPVNVDGRTALHIAASTGNVEIIKCLIDSGADLNIKDKLTSHTALDKALSKNKEEAAKLLLQKGAASGSNKYDGIIERLSKELAAKGEAPRQKNSDETPSKVNTDFVSKLSNKIETQAGLSP